MTTSPRFPGLPTPVTIRRAGIEDRLRLERLWLLFRHDMSAFTGDLPGADGTYRSEWLALALNGEPGWHAWILTVGDHPAGLGITRAMDEPLHVLNSFFLVVPLRRTGLGTRFARTIMTSTPGRWEVAYQERNQAAARFWPAVAGQLDPEWLNAIRPTPGRPELPPDRWISLTASCGD
jgi:predicted acetyltransferase